MAQRLDIGTRAAEAFRQELRAGTFEAVRRVRIVEMTSTDPRVVNDARDYLKRVLRPVTINGEAAA